MLRPHVVDPSSRVGTHVRRRPLFLNMLNDPMKPAKYTFALLMTTCIAWGCTTQGTSTVPAHVAGPSSEVGVTASAAQGATSQINPADPNVDLGVAALKAALHARYPATQFREVTATPSAGIYEVVMGNKVAYTDVTGRYFLFGHLFDMVTQQDLTVPLEQALQKVQVSCQRRQSQPILDRASSATMRGASTRARWQACPRRTRSLWNARGPADGSIRADT